MISFKCRCGETLRVKDEHAGRKLRCPKCSKVVQIPQPEVDDDIEEIEEIEEIVEDDYEEERPQRRASKSRAPAPKGRAGKKSSKSRSKRSGGASPLKRVGGVLAILLGLAMVAGGLMALKGGNVRALRIGVPAIVCFSVGYKWLTGSEE